MLYIFLDHPKSVCLTYIQHMWFSLHLSWLFGKASTHAFIHAFVPSLFKKSSSLCIDYVSKKMLEVGCRKKAPLLSISGDIMETDEPIFTPIQEV
jgi:hypothetical protein